MSGSVAAADQGAQLNRLYLLGSGNVDKYDEIRMGDSFLDVTGVPEPSTYALLFGLGSIGVVAYRRRTRA